MVTNENMISDLKDKLSMCYFYLELLRKYECSFNDNAGSFQYYQGQLNLYLVLFEMSEFVLTGKPTQNNLDFFENGLNKIKDYVNDKYKDL